MKCVSIHQPWAAAIFAGLVDTEYRCYPTDYRGDLLVHASQDVSDWDRRQLAFFGKRAPCWERLLFGRVIGVVELWSCELGSNGEWVWRLRNPRLVKPFPINPGRRLFEVEDQRIKVLASHGSATGNSRENIEQTGEAMRALSVLKARDPERRRKIAEARRGKPRPPHFGEAVVEAHRDTHHSEEARRKMSETHQQRGTLVPGTILWTAEEDEWVRTLPTQEAVRRTGRTLSAVKARRRRLGVLDGRRRN